MAEITSGGAPATRRPRRSGPRRLSAFSRHSIAIALGAGCAYLVYYVLRKYLGW
jgi:hypothetical protein